MEHFVLLQSLELDSFLFVVVLRVFWRGGIFHPFRCKV